MCCQSDVADKISSKCMLQCAFDSQYFVPPQSDVEVALQSQVRKVFQAHVVGRNAPSSNKIKCLCCHCSVVDERIEFPVERKSRRDGLVRI